MNSSSLRGGGGKIKHKILRWIKNSQQLSPPKKTLQVGPGADLWALLRWQLFSSPGPAIALDVFTWPPGGSCLVLTVGGVAQYRTEEDDHRADGGGACLFGANGGFGGGGTYRPETSNCGTAICWGGGQVAGLKGLRTEADPTTVPPPPIPPLAPPARSTSRIGSQFSSRKRCARRSTCRTS